MISDVLLFGGQGLRNLPSSKALYGQSSSPSGIAKIFLTACHEAFRHEFEALSIEQKETAGSAADLCFEGPDSLLFPPQSLQSNAVVQSTNLYLHQILGFISYSLTPALDSKRAATPNDERKFVEAAGFCSGIISAIIAGCYRGNHDQSFITTAVDGFRLSFWVGIRSAEFCQSHSTSPTDTTPWSLTISGLSVSDVTRAVDEFNQTYLPQLPLRVSTVLHKQIISVAGEGSSLGTFQSRYLGSARSSFANVHGYYHGGKAMEPSLVKVLDDMRQRGIHFPSWDDLNARVRFATDPSRFAPQDKSISLLEAALRMILVEEIDWDSIAGQLVIDMKSDLESNPTARYRVLAVKPNARPLLRTLRDEQHHSRLDIEEFLPEAAINGSENDVAIVGMSVNFPSGKGQDQLWETLERGLNVVQEIPETRFKVSQYHHPDTEKPNEARSMETKYGNFLDDPFTFDNTFFSISPREARSMDPQQRILLHAAFEALQDAGYVPNATPSFQTESVGVYTGVATLDYVENTRDAIDVYYSPGTLRAFLSGRISYAFQLKGPSVVTDTACSSSTVSIYQACRALQVGDCTSALAGGVNIISSPDMYLGLDRAHFLSATGQCKPFDAAADGYCRAEGCGMFVLKRLSDAIAENDHIYGVIKGVEVNQCGTAKSITHPDTETQTALIRKLLRTANVSADSINVVEAHGTGTQAGDSAEANSLSTALCQSRTSTNHLTISSIKGNIGHAEAASGAAGLAKLLLMLKRKSIPPQASFSNLNPRLEILDQNGIQIPRELKPWLATSQYPRRALLNNFGAAGSNAALIIEEFVKQEETVSSHDRSSHILNLSAKTSTALEHLRNSYVDFMTNSLTDRDLFDFCYSTTARRQCFDQYRISITGESLADLRSKLSEAKISAESTNIRERPLIFVFSGQGSVFPGMGHELFATVPSFAQDVLTCDRILDTLGLPGVRSMLCTPPDGADDARGSTERDVIIAHQCACFVLEYALARLWLSWGVQPDMLIGHSIGEYAALTIAGSLSLYDALFLVGKRAELMVESCATNCSGMVASSFSGTAADQFLTENNLKDISVCCNNSPKHSAVAGPLKSLQKFEKLAKNADLKVKMLDVPYAFHSSFMDPIEEALAELAAEVRITTPKIPVISSYLGRKIESSDLGSGHFAGHARNPVEFEKAAKSLEKAIESMAAVFIEIGPAPSTLPLIKATMNGADHCYIPSLKPMEKSWLTMSSALESLFLHRCTVDWRATYDGSNAQFTPNMPKYPLNGSHFLVPFEERTSPVSSEVLQQPNLRTSYKFSKAAQISKTDDSVSLDLDIDTLAPLIQAHKVGGVPLCPASVYIELALEAIDVQESLEHSRFCILSKIEFSSPLVHSQQTASQVVAVFDSSTDTFRITSSDADEHCVGTLDVTDVDAIDQDFARKTSFINRQLESIQFTDTFTSHILYETVFTRVVSYSNPFLTLKQMRVASSGLEGIGTFEIALEERHGFSCPPSFTDTMLHAAGFVANSKINAEEACICVKVERVTLPINASSIYDQTLSVYCSLLDCSDGHLIGDAYVLDSSSKVVASVEGMHFKKLQLKAFSAHLARSRRSSSISVPPKSTVAFSEPVSRSSRSSISTASHSDAEVERTSGSKKSLQTSLSATDVQATLQSTLSQVCGISGPIDTAVALSDFGVDSLLFIELASSLQEQFPSLGLSKTDFEKCESFLDMQNLILNQSADHEDTASNVQHPPDSREVSADAMLEPHATSKDNHQQAIRDYFQEVCGFSLTEASKDVRLCELGIDSLLSIELVAGLRENFDLPIEENLDISELRVCEFERMFSKESENKPHTAPSSGKDDSISKEFLQPLDIHDSFPSKIETSKNSSAPLYLIHDGSGLCSVYTRLSKMERDVFGIFSLDFQNLNRSVLTMQQLATLYIKESKMTSFSEIILGGWSFGGVVAFEIARQLRKQGTRVKGVVLIDSPHPVSHEPLPAEIISYLSTSMPAKTKATEQMKKLIKAQFHRNANLLANYNLLPNESDNAIPCVMLKCRKTFDSIGLCGVSYPWVCDEASRQQSIKIWESLVGKSITVLEVDGDHFTLFDPQNIGDVSTQLRKACEML